MGPLGIFLFVFVGGIVLAVVWSFVSGSLEERRAREAGPAAQAALKRRKEKALADAQERAKELSLGLLRPEMVCPHCKTRGEVRTRPVKRKAGVSGGKATGAILTGGVSILATGLSRKEGATAATCENCGAEWSFS